MKSFFVISALLITIGTFAQQLPQYTQFLSSYSLLNPSHALYESDQINICARSQMIGFGLEPNTAVIYGFAKIKPKKLNKYNPYIRISQEIPEDTSRFNRFFQGIGAGIMSDKPGALNFLSAQINYSLGYAFMNNWKMSGSIRAGISNASINMEKLTVLNITDPYDDYYGGDIIYDELINSANPINTIQFGFSGTIKSDELVIGFSMDQITVKYLLLTGNNIFYNPKIQYTTLMAYNYKIDGFGTIRTGVLFKKMTPAPPSFELSTMLFTEQALFGGIHYRHNSSIGIIGGLLLNKNFKISYSFDYITTRLNSFSYGGHEITLGYSF